MILPLRRYCPRFFSLPALVAGSVAPDFGYFLAPVHLDEPAHRCLGSLWVSVPLGALALALAYTVRSLALRKLSHATRPRLLNLPWPPLGSPLVIVISLIAGAWSHVFLDSLTHPGGWLAGQIPALQFSLGFFLGHTVRVCSFLWYAFSFAGAAMVFAALRRWEGQYTVAADTAKSLLAGWAGPVLVASAVLPIQLVHHLVSGWPGMVAVAVMTLLLLVWIVWKNRPRPLTGAQCMPEAPGSNVRAAPPQGC